MPVIYPEGGMPGLLLKQRQAVKPGIIDTFKVQLVPLRPAPKSKIGGPEDVSALVREMEDYDRESAKLIHLDTKNQVMGVETISIGSLSASIVHPRETVKGAILNNSANVIFVHNHPSGVCEPSNEDIEISGKLKEAFEMVGIVLLDSIIVGKGCYYSLRETGFISGQPERVRAVSEPRISIVSEGRRTPVRGMYPEICRTCRFECAICPHYVSSEKKVHKFVGIRKITDKVSTVREAGQERAPAEVEIKHEPGKIFPWRVVYAGTDKTVQTKEYPEAMAYYTEREAERGITEEGLTLVKKGSTPTTVSENITGQSKQPIQKYIGEYQDFMKKEEAGLRVKLDKVSVCTGKPITESQVMGAATPMNGHLMGHHLTDNPDEVVRRLQSDNLIAMNPTGDLGGGLYISSVPDYWRVRSQRKWDFAKNLTKTQRQSLVNVILADPRYRKGGGYLADFEVDRMHRDLNMYVESGDVTYLVITGNQPYNVSITAEITMKAGVAPPKEPGLVEVTLSGKFIDAAGLYTNPLRDEVINRARVWGLINKPELMGFTLNTKNVVNAWLDSMGYSGMFTRSGMSTNPEMVIWDRKAIIRSRKVV